MGKQKLLVLFLVLVVPAAPYNTSEYVVSTTCWWPRDDQEYQFSLTQERECAFKGGSLVILQENQDDTEEQEDLEEEARCPEGFVRLEPGGKKCYWFSGSYVDTWEAARGKCRALGGQLVSVHTSSENEVIKSYIRRTNPMDHFLGAKWSGPHHYNRHSSMGWRWEEEQDGDMSFHFSDWSNSQVMNQERKPPGERMEQQDLCVTMAIRKDLHWTIHPCSWHRSFICQTTSSLWVAHAQSEVLAPCPPGFSRLGPEGCFYFSQQKSSSWYTASSACNMLGAQLAKIDNAQLDRILTMQAAYHMSQEEAISGFWVGARYHLTDGWLWAPSLRPLIYTHWQQQEEEEEHSSSTSNSNSAGSDTCLALNPTWTPVPCFRAMRFVCETRRRPNAIVDCPPGYVSVAGSSSASSPECYWFSGIFTATWDAAMMHCRNLHGGHLATIHSKAQMTALREYLYLLSPRDYYLGASDLDQKGEWLWEDGQTPMYFAQWLTEDNAASNDQHQCLLLSERHEYLWSKVDCVSRRSYICQTHMRHWIAPKKPEAQRWCPSRFMQLGLMGCYHIGKEILSFLAAKAACEKLDAHLVSVDSVLEHRLLSRLLAKVNTVDMYVGSAYQAIQRPWAWKTPTDYQECDVINFGPETDNEYRHNNRHEIDCKKLLPYVCETDRRVATSSSSAGTSCPLPFRKWGRRGCYYVVEMKKTWNESHDLCDRLHHSHLLSVDHPEEAQLLLTFLGLDNTRPSQERLYWMQQPVTPFQGEEDQDELEDGDQDVSSKKCPVYHYAGPYQQPYILKNCDLHLFFICELS